MAHMPDILKRIADGGGWIPSNFEAKMEGADDFPQSSPCQSQEEYDIVWKKSIGALLEPATALIEATKDGLEHAGLQLEIIPRPGDGRFFNWMPGARRNAKTDLEAEGELLKPGTAGFSKTLEDKLCDFRTRRIDALTAWADSEGLTEEQLEKLKTLGEFDVDESPAGAHVLRDRQQLYLILYIQHMVRKTTSSIIPYLLPWRAVSNCLNRSIQLVLQFLSWLNSLMRLLLKESCPEID